MTQRHELVTYLDNLLAINDISDSSWNGLQVQGKEDIRHIGVAVDSSLEVFQHAVKNDIDFVIVHHGIFWKSAQPNIISYQLNRVGTLLEKEISLYAAHLPLDRHRDLGNNAQLIILCGANITDPFLQVEKQNISWIGNYSTPSTINSIQEKISLTLNIKPRVLPFGPAKIKTLAVCSGGGGYDSFFAALKVGADLYITGDTIDIYQLAKDAGIHVIFAGHHATETLGVKALAKKIEVDFDLTTSFISFPTNL